MADFQPAGTKTLFNEGGYLSEAQAAKNGDAGGETYCGIARNYNQDWAGWAIIDAYKTAHGIPKWNSKIADPNLDALVLARMKEKYWDTIHAGELLNQDTANLVFDIHYNSGNFGSKQIQRAVNSIAHTPILVDGDIGGGTIAAINALPAADIYTQIYAVRKAWVDKEIAAGVGGSNDWLARLERYPSKIN